MTESQRPIVTILTAGCNERENLPELFAKIDRAFRGLGVSGEVIFVNDGSTDGSREVLDELCGNYEYLRVVHERQRRGLGEVLNTGFRLARGEIIMILPADLESDPEEDIPKLLAEVHKGADLVAGWRQGRHGPKAFFSKLYNWISGKIFGVSVHDIDWIKALRRETIQGIHFRSGWHRFMIPIIAHKGYRITEVPTSWYPRTYGKSKFGLRHLPEAFFDAITVKFLLSFSSRPMLFFGRVGCSLLFLAFLSGLCVIFLDVDILNRRLALTALIFTVFAVGISCILAGLVGELCSYYADRSEHAIRSGTEDQAQ